MNKHLFLKAESTIGRAIDRAVALTHDDPRQPLSERMSWVDAGGPERRRTLFQSTRYRLEADRPQFESIIGQLAAEHGEDDEAAGAAFQELADERGNPILRESLDRELASATAAAIHAWVAGVPGVAREPHPVSPDAAAEHQAWVRATVCGLGLAKDQAAVRVDVGTAGCNTVLLTLSVAEIDRRHVIGRGGEVVWALRTLVSAAGAACGQHLVLELEDEAGRR